MTAVDTKCFAETLKEANKKTNENNTSKKKNYRKPLQTSTQTMLKDRVLKGGS